MAAEKAAVASGADFGDGLRKRHGNNATQQDVVAQPEDKKKSAKKVRLRDIEASTLLQSRLTCNRRTRPSSRL